MAEERCVLCKEPLPRQNPQLSIRKSSRYWGFAMNSNLRLNWLSWQRGVRAVIQLLVHAECRKKFTDKGKCNVIENPRKKLRSSTDFDWKTKCFLCEISIDPRHPDRDPISTVTTQELKKIFLITQNKEMMSGVKP